MMNTPDNRMPDAHQISNLIRFLNDHWTLITLMTFGLNNALDKKKKKQVKKMALDEMKARNSYIPLYGQRHSYDYESERQWIAFLTFMRNRKREYYRMLKKQQA